MDLQLKEVNPELEHSDGDEDKKLDKKGRRKIKIEFIDDKSRRHITFSKRKLGIMKKAWELSTLTGTQVLLLVASETGHVYTFATPKLQPLITKPEGKNLIQSCLNTPDSLAAQPNRVGGRGYDQFGAAEGSSEEDKARGGQVAFGTYTGLPRTGNPAQMLPYPAAYSQGVPYPNVRE